jgi:hypothetical protein
VKINVLFLVCILFFGIISCTKTPKSEVGEEATMNDNVFIEKQIGLIDNIIKMHDNVKNIHTSLEKLYPITVINNGYFFVFDINEAGNKYEFKFKTETPMPISGDILAAFSLDFYHMKPSAVISKNILENQNNYINIFHEFVHCFQMGNGEFDIRKELLIEKQEMEKNNYSWEINFPFPYNNEYFINKTMELSDYFINNGYENVVNYHRDMKTYLQKVEYEYMIWQEWKEGFARYVENLIRKELGLQLNTNVLRQPFDRVHFYEIGNKYIEMLVKNDKELNINIIKLFNKMNIGE